MGPSPTAEPPGTRSSGAHDVTHDGAGRVLGHQRQGGDPARVGPQAAHQPDLDGLLPGRGLAGEGGPVDGVDHLDVSGGLAADQHRCILAAGGRVVALGSGAEGPIGRCRRERRRQDPSSATRVRIGRHLPSPAAEVESHAAAARPGSH